MVYIIIIRAYRLLKAGAVDTPLSIIMYNIYKDNMGLSQI